MSSDEIWMKKKKEPIIAKALMISKNGIAPIKNDDQSCADISLILVGQIREYVTLSNAGSDAPSKATSWCR
jgi:hypothetical protein